MTATTSRVLTGLGVLGAVALVAVATRGRTPASTGETRRPSDTLLDLLFSLYVVALGLGLALVVLMLVLRRFAVLTENPDLRGSPFRSLLVLALFFGGMVLAVRWLELREPALTLPTIPPAETRGDLDAAVPPEGEQYRAEFAWKPMLGLAALVGLGLLAWWRSSRARRGLRVREPRQTLAEALADVLAETLDAIRAEPDPRRAVIGAYARLERVAAASGVARRPAEAPLEYLGRMLSGLEVGAPAVRRLTTLFERAKFSNHAVDEAMKQEAIHALESVQRDLREAEARAEQARADAQAEARDRLRERARA